MVNTFRLYGSMRSSYFDLISGGREPQQTKGLGLLLAKSEQAAKAFLSISKIQAILPESVKNSIKKLKFELKVCCELPFKDSKNNDSRIDIFVEFYKDSKLELILVIEAKSFNKETTFLDTTDQLDRYINSGVLAKKTQIGSDRIFGIILTKHEYVGSSKHISLSWLSIIEAFKKIRDDDGLVDDYLSFLTNIRGSMKFYDREVLSIPTKDSSQEAVNKFGIYVCPNTNKYALKYKPLFLTFRQSNGGVMTALYKLEEIIILNFVTAFKEFCDDENYKTNGYVRRVKEYRDFLVRANKWKDEDYNCENQVFILSQKPIELEKKPRPEKNNSYRCYYAMADLINGVPDLRPVA